MVMLDDHRSATAVVDQEKALGDIVQPTVYDENTECVPALGQQAPPNNANPTSSSHISSSIKKLEQQLVTYHLEARGIQRVEESERIKLSWFSYVQAFLLWVSINLAANNISLGMLGPAVFELSFLDSALCAVLGAAVGSGVVAWVATWGPVSGNRTMVRYIIFY